MLTRKKGLTRRVYVYTLEGMEPKQFASARKKLGMTQAAFAREIGVTVTTVSRWEIGVHRVPTATAQLIERLVAEAKEKRSA